MSDDTKKYPSGRMCPDCGREIMLFDIPYINAIGQELKCQCVEEREEQERQARISTGKSKAHEKMRAGSGMGKRYLLYTFSRFRRTESNGSAAATAEQFAADYCAGNTKSGGLLFCGNTGTGKTFLACAVGNYVIDQSPVSDNICEDLANGYVPMGGIWCPVTFFGTADLMQRIRSSFNGYGAGESGASLIEQCKRAKLLILDDFGAEKISDWVREVVYDIIEHRWQNCLHTVLTTNETMAGLRGKYGERIADRVRSMCVTVPMTGSSQRKTAREGGNTP